MCEWDFTMLVRRVSPIGTVKCFIIQDNFSVDFYVQSCMFSS